ncbi:MAG: HAD-IA family hydrolase [Bacteroidales bacterium]|nr:HAD-IA family hydrolase [Muribaculaceae bacterium]MBQ5409241.1 HAD-IA family hydrolase [Muribaculaceae bacterium]MDY6411802.1 HAD-IA family hydrolase [Bacteroidales bacterium]
MTEQNAIANYYKYTGKKTFNFTTALVDMDGVLFDSMKNHTRAWVKLMKKNGIKCTRDEFYMYEGMTGRDIIKMKFKDGAGKNITDDEAQALYKVKTRYFTELGDVEMIDGTLSLLKALKAAGIKCVLVTGSGTQSMLDRVDADYEGIFDEQRVTAADVKRGKPNPEPYLKAMAKVNAQPNECIVLENAPLGVQAGHTAGCFTVGVTTGPIAEKDMYKAGADIVYPSMAAMEEALPALIEALKTQK